MPIERTREPLPTIDLPLTYGDLYSFMTLTCNGEYDRRRHTLIEDAGFMTLERSLREAMSSPDAKDEEARLPKDIVLAAKHYLQSLNGKISFQDVMKAQVERVGTGVRALAAMIMGKREESVPDLQ